MDTKELKALLETVVAQHVGIARSMSTILHKLDDTDHCPCGVKLAGSYAFCPSCGKANAHYSQPVVSTGKAPVVAIPTTEDTGAKDSAIRTASGALRLDSEQPDNMALDVANGVFSVHSRLNTFSQQTPTGEKVVATTGVVGTPKGFVLRRFTFHYAGRTYMVKMDLRDTTDAKYPDRKGK